MEIWSSSSIIKWRLLLILFQLAIVSYLCIYYYFRTQKEYKEAYAKGWVKIAVRYGKVPAICWVTIGTLRLFSSMEGQEVRGRLYWHDELTEFPMEQPDYYIVVSKGRYYGRGNVFK